MFKFDIPAQEPLPLVLQSWLCHPPLGPRLGCCTVLDLRAAHSICSMVLMYWFNNILMDLVISINNLVDFLEVEWFRSLISDGHPAEPVPGGYHQVLLHPICHCVSD